MAVEHAGLLAARGARHGHQEAARLFGIDAGAIEDQRRDIVGLALLFLGVGDAADRAADIGARLHGRVGDIDAAPVGGGSAQSPEQDGADQGADRLVALAGRHVIGGLVADLVGDHHRHLVLVGRVFDDAAVDHDQAVRRRRWRSSTGWRRRGTARCRRRRASRGRSGWPPGGCAEGRRSGSRRPPGRTRNAAAARRPTAPRLAPG